MNAAATATTGFEVGARLPEQQRTADTVQLFLYNAAIWNPHRIHYDLPYTQQHEGHPGLLIDGPLQGDWLLQAASAFVGDAGELQAFRYSNRRAAYSGQTLHIGGEIKAADADSVTLALHARNADGVVTTTGEAVFSRRRRPDAP